MDEAGEKCVDSIGEYTLISCGSYSAFALPAVLVRGRWYSDFFPSFFSWLFVVCCPDSIGCIWTSTVPLMHFTLREYLSAHPNISNKLRVCEFVMIKRCRLAG